MAERRCKEIFAALSAYLDGELGVKDCRSLERHLQGCEPCLAYLDSLKTTIQVCRGYRISKVPRPSARVAAALRRALRR